jgi:hypothetical protein
MPVKYPARPRGTAITSPGSAIWSPSSVSYRRTSSTGNTETPARICGWRSSSGSRGPTTANAVNTPSAGSPLPSSRYCTTPLTRPDRTYPSESTKLGADPRSIAQHSRPTGSRSASRVPTPSAAYDRPSALLPGTISLPPRSCASGLRNSGERGVQFLGYSARDESVEVWKTPWELPHAC